MITDNTIIIQQEVILNNDIIIVKNTYLINNYCCYVFKYSIFRNGDYDTLAFTLLD